MRLKKLFTPELADTHQKVMQTAFENKGRNYVFDTNVDIQEKFGLLVVQDGEKVAKVQAYLKKMTANKTKDKWCVCGKKADANTVVLALCNHEFHWPCIEKYWTFAPSYGVLSCPVCAVDYQEKIRSIRINTSTMKAQLETFKTNLKNANADLPYQLVSKKASAKKEGQEMYDTEC